MGSLKGAGANRKDKGMVLAFISDALHWQHLYKVCLEGKIHMETCKDLKFDKMTYVDAYTHVSSIPPRY